jgi:hypothetical protein
MSVSAEHSSGSGRRRTGKRPRGDRHLGETALAELAARERGPSQQESRHLQGCEACRGALQSTRTILKGLRFRSQGPGEQALRRAGSLLKRARRAAERPAELVSHWRPGLAVVAPAGLRSASPATRQWLFRAAAMDIDLQSFAEGPETRRLMGQVLGPEGAVEGLPVHVRHDGPPHMCVTDSHGEFSCGPVRGSAVKLVVESEEGLHSLELGSLPFEAEADAEDLS